MEARETALKDAHAPPPLPAGLSRKRAVGTALAAWAATVLAIFALDKLAPLSGFVMENLQVMAAALFLYLPTWLLSRQGCDQDAYGLHGREPLRQVGVAFAVSAVVFPLFVLGFHGWQRVALDRNLRMDREILVRWPVELEGRPGLPGRSAFAVWDERGALTVLWGRATGSAPVEVEIALDAPPEAVQEAFLSNGALHTRALLARGPVARHPSEEGTVRVRAVAPGGVRVTAHAANQARITLRAAGEDAPEDAVALGRYALTPGDPPPLHVERGWLWLLTFVLVQLLVVGLPEEVFYRGLLQPRLQLVLPPRLRILGAPFGWATVVTSLLFALGHYLVDFAPGRLAVFFPSLLFGWIRNRTGSVAAGAVFHGLSNVLLAILNRAYVG